MSVQRIPSLLCSLMPHFENQTAIRLTNSQFDLMRDIVTEYCHTHDAPRLYGMLGRIKRRMNQKQERHMWQTEFEYLASLMMDAMKEESFCRDEDDLQNLNEILARHNVSSKPGKNRFDDKGSSILSLFSLKPGQSARTYN